MGDRNRERFVAFSFARADVLFEMDRQGKITFVVGAAKNLFGVDAPLTGSSFPSFISQEFSTLRAQIVEAAASGKRVPISDCDLIIGGRKVSGDIAACPLPDQPGSLFLTFHAFTEAELKARAPLAPPSEVQAIGVPKDTFVATANKLAASAKGSELSLTLLGLDKGTQKLSDMPSAQRDAVRTSVNTVLRAVGADERAVSEVAPDRFGVVHDSKIGSDVIREKIAGLMKRVSPDLDCGVNTVRLRPVELSQEDAARALVFAINKFASQADGDFTINNLSDVLETRFHSAVAQIAEFRQMVGTKAFELWYQPIVDLGKGETHHQEALCRFQDGRSPFSTVVFAEEAGLITDLDYYVAERAVETILHVSGAVDIAINVSGRSFETPLFIAHLEALLERLDGQRQRLLLEVTESSKIHDLSKVNKAIEKFRKLGHKVCIDDFGSGSAAFDYLRALNVDVVKIDGKFIRDLPKSARDQSFVRAIQAMCTQLRCETVAEMVEGAEHAALLKDIGVDHAQGYFYAKPAKKLAMRQSVGGGDGSHLKIA